MALGSWCYEKRASGDIFFSVLDTRLDQILPKLILCPSKSFKPCTEKKNLFNGRDILTAPWYVSVSTKYGIVHFDDCHCGSPPIAVAVECRCRPAVCLSVPTLHKPAPLWTQEDWLYVGKQLTCVVVVVEAGKNSGIIKATYTKNRKREKR